MGNTTRMKIGEFYAYDENGNSFKKIIEADISEPKPFDFYGKDILYIDGPISYYITNLKKSYPFESPLCIDINGQLHKGTATYLSADTLNSIFNIYIALKKGVI